MRGLEPSSVRHQVSSCVGNGALLAPMPQCETGFWRDAASRFRPPTTVIVNCFIYFPSGSLPYQKASHSAYPSDGYVLYEAKRMYERLPSDQGPKCPKDKGAKFPRATCGQGGQAGSESALATYGQTSRSRGSAPRRPCAEPRHNGARRRA